MGLDIYIERITGATDSDGKQIKEEVYYWRKFGELHNLMSEIWHRDNEEEFNCQYLPLTEEICTEVIQHLHKPSSLPDHYGFFFGQSNKEDRDYLTDALKKWKDIKKRVKNGEELAYFAWY